MDGYKSGWYKEWFGEDYLTVYQHRDNKDAEQLVGLIEKHINLPSSARILDLACGNGRHSFILARRFMRVFGLDLSTPLLQKALRSKKNKQTYPCFIQGDMRALPFKPAFNLVLSLFTSFGYFDEEEEHERVAREMGRILLPGGYFVMDYFNAPYVRAGLKAEGEREFNGRRIYEKRWIKDRRVIKKIEIEYNGTTRTYYESVRMFEADELQQLLRAGGIETLYTFGDYNGGALHTDAPRLIIIGKKDVPA